MHQGNLELFLIFLLAAVLAVPLSKRLGMGAVLGYLVAGVLMGPFGFRVVKDPESVLAFSELGVVLLLFVIGLELSPSRLWVMRRSVFGVGGLQVAVTTLALGAAAMIYGMGWKASLVVGLGLALSSTAVGLQLLAERKELQTGFGRLGFAILLVQDLVAIPLLALIPLLGTHADNASNASLAEDALRALGMIALVVLGGRLLLRQLFRAVAWAKSPDVFTATSLLVVVGTAWLVQLGGLSMGLGAFLAGLLLADSEFRHELEAQIEPFKGLLLGLFFIAVGMSVDLLRVRAEPLLIGGGVAVLLGIKALVLFGIGWRPGRLRAREALMLAAVLALGGEFAFVVFTEAFRNGLIDGVARDRFVAVIGLSMAVTPLIVIGISNWLQMNPEKKVDRPADEIDHESPRVIIAGFGRMGQIVGRMLRAQRIPFTALEHSVEQVELSRRFGTMIYYGDPGRADLLRAAHVERAEAFVLTTDDPEASVRTARLLRRLYPHLKVFARARNRQHAFKLMDLGVEVVVRETFHSSLELGEQVLKALGLPPEAAAERRERFRKHDERMLLEQHLVYDDEAALIASSQQALADLERLFEADEVPLPDEPEASRPLPLD
jgi:glutathione-regulated potassium-efflux system protein KefB